MLTDIQRDYLAKSVRTSQIIVGALAGGIAVFMVVVVAITKKDDPSGPLITFVGLAFAVMAFAGWLFLPGILTRQTRKSLTKGHLPQSDAPSEIGSSEIGSVEPLANLFQTRLIVANALLEGAAFFNLVAYMVEGQAISLVVAAVLLLLIVSQIPSRNRLEVWVSHELETLEQMQI